MNKRVIMTDKEWNKFLKWLKEAHHLSVIYTPNKMSVQLWEEYKCQKTLKKPATKSLKK